MQRIATKSLFVLLLVRANSWIGHAAPSPYQSQVLADKPIAYFSFEEASRTTAKNDAAQTATAPGTYSPGPAKGEAGPRPPEFAGFNSDNRSASFNGTADSVTAGLPLLDGLDAFTIELWVKELAR